MPQIYMTNGEAGTLYGSLLHDTVAVCVNEIALVYRVNAGINYNK